MGSNFTGASNKTIPELIRELTGKGAPHRYDADKLRGKIAITYALQASGLGKEEFSRRFIGNRGTASGLIYKWLCGDNVPTLRSIARIEAAFPGTAALLLHPFFQLLADRPLTVAQIRKLLRGYSSNKQVPWAWRFGDEEARISDRSALPILARTDTKSLRLRADLDGAAVILGLVREAEALGRTQDHRSFIADLYRCLPSLAALPGFRLHLRLLWHCVQSIHLRDLLSHTLLRVHWSLLRSLSSTKVQSKMSSYPYRDFFWREAEKTGFDVVEFVDPKSQRLLKDVCRVDRC